MIKKLLLLSIAASLLVFVTPVVQAQQGGGPPDNAPPPPQEPPQPPPEPDPPDPPDDPGPPDESAVAMPNLSFPAIHTDIIEMFYLRECIDLNADGVCSEDEWFLFLDGDGLPVPIPVDEVIVDEYEGDYPEIDSVVHVEYVLDPDTGCPVDVDQDGKPDVVETPQITYLQANEPWYPQAVTITDPDCMGDPNFIWDDSCVEPSNSWQAEWLMLAPEDPVVFVDFVDWADVLESSPEWEMGRRVPLDVALYEKTTDGYYVGDGSFDPALAADETMSAYKTSLLEYHRGPDELFGVSTLNTPDELFWEEVYFASVLTNKYFVEVCPPIGPCERTKMLPTLNPNGRMTYKASGYGFIPEMEGIHRIWIHFNDPLVSLSGAVVNDLSNYVLSTGCMADEMDWLKALKTGIIGDSTFLDLNVVENRGDDPPPTPKPR